MYRIQCMVAGLIVLMCLASPAHSQLIDRIYRFPSASYVDIGLDAAGNVYAAHVSPDSDDVGIWVSRLSPDLALLGPEVAANTSTFGRQGSPAIGVHSDGRHAVIWMNPYGCCPIPSNARWFGSDGVPLGDEGVVEVYTPAMFAAMRDDGLFQFGYMYYGHHWPEGWFYVHRLDTSYNTAGGGGFGPFTVSGHASVCATGEIWVASNVDLQDFETTIECRLLNGGQWIEFDVPETLPANDQSRAIVTSDIRENGQSVVVWSDWSSATYAGTMKAQRFGADGSPIGAIQTITEGAHGYAFEVALFPSGDYVVQWVQDDAIHMKRYFVDFDFVAPAFTVPTQGRPGGVSLEADPDMGHVFCSYTIVGTNPVTEIVRIPILTGTVPVLFARAGATPVRDGVRLDWELSFDEAVEGMRIYREAGGSTIDVSGGLLPNDTRTFTDAGVVPGTEYEYTIAAVRPDRSEVMSAPIRVQVPGAGLSLSQSVPNPFHDSARIDYSIDERRQTSLVIYDARGAHVATLQDGVVDPGSHTATWNSRDRTGRRVPAGVYFAVLRSGSTTLSRKMVIIR